MADNKFNYSGDVAVRRLLAKLKTVLSGYAKQSEVNSLSSAITDYGTLTLGVHTDGLVYLFKKGSPVGVGIELPEGGGLYGYVDSENNIVLKGSYANGTLVKWEMEDGTIVDIGEMVYEEEATYTNLANPTDANWLTNKRYNSSKVLTDITDAQRGTDTLIVTNFIDVTSKPILHVKNLELLRKTNGGQDYTRLYFYNDQSTLLAVGQPMVNNVTCYTAAEYDENVLLINLPKLFSEMAASYKYCRIGGILTDTADNVIITAGEEIV